MVEDGTEVKEGERVIEFDASRLIQSIEEQRLRLRQAENARESQQRTMVAEADKKRVAVEKAEVEAEKARIDADVPKELPVRGRVAEGAGDLPAGQSRGREGSPRSGGLPYLVALRSRGLAAHRREGAPGDGRRREVPGRHVRSRPQERHLPRRQLLQLGPRRAAQAPARRHGLAGLRGWLRSRIRARWRWGPCCPRWIIGPSLAV